LLRLRKTPRGIQVKKLSDELALLQEEDLSFESAMLSEVESFKIDSIEFFQKILEVEPTDYRKEFLELF
jgi:hypothetical protein